MSCSKPYPAIQLYPGMKPRFLRQVDGNFAYWREKYGKNFILIPCGKCLGCALDYSKKWAVRIMLESTLYESNSFITLTFLDAFMPHNKKTGEMLLLKKPFQKFMKRLRKEFGSGVRFFACGERGSTTGRPHYHAILFGVDFDDKKFLMKGKSGENIFTSEKLQKLWPFGFSSIGSVTTESAAYVARYSMKKRIIDDGVVDDSFILMSRRPGIGAKLYSQTWFYSSKIYTAEGHTSVPRFFAKLFEQKDPFLFAIWKEEQAETVVPDKRFAYGISTEEELLKYLGEMRQARYEIMRS